MSHDASRSILAQSPGFILRHEWEQVILVRRATGEKRFIGEHYGDPSCGAIAPDESSFVSGGEGIVFFDFKRGLQLFFRRGHPPFAPEPRDVRYVEADGVERKLTTVKSQGNPWCVHALRFEGFKVRVLIDPWSDEASVWQLDTIDLSLQKLRDGPSLRDEPHRDDVEF